MATTADAPRKHPEVSEADDFLSIERLSTKLRHLQKAELFLVDHGSSTHSFAVQAVVTHEISTTTGLAEKKASESMPNRKDRATWEI